MKTHWGFVREHRITPDESDALLALTSRTLKIAGEFEFNLQGEAGSCYGDENNSNDGLMHSSACPCVNKDKFNCATRCAIDHVCSTIPNRAKCKKNNNGSCSLSDYPKCPTNCDRFEFDCIGGNSCLDFIPPCNYGCQWFKKDCTNCKEFYFGETVPSNVRDSATKRYRPSGAVERFGATGVEKVTTDNSLLGDKGIEICTVGRRFNLKPMLSLNKDICEFCLDKGAYINNRCSLHNHALIGHFPDIDIHSKTFIVHEGHTAHKSYEAKEEYTEMESPIPSVVLSNLIQIVRRFMPALVWLSCSGNSKHHLTRWSKFRQPFIDFSPITLGPDGFINKCATVFTHLTNKPQDKGKYGFINFNHIVFSQDELGEIDPKFIKRFHIEFRYMDGLMSGTAITAFNALHYALIMKAIRISRYGLLESFSDAQEFQETRELLFSIMNNNPPNWGGERDSETIEVFETGKDELLRNDARTLISFLTSEFGGMECMKDVLLSLAEKPSALRLIEGQTWSEIENSLYSLTKLGNDTESIVQAQEIIDMVGVALPSKNVGEWFAKVTEELNGEVDTTLLREDIEHLVSCNRVRWDEDAGVFVSI